jgi:membrane protein YqaA with SNARE-associated domain
VSDIFGIVLRFVLGFGLLGVFVLAALDSTFIFYLPFAMDAVLIILVTKHESWMPVYAITASAGSVAGCLFTYYIASKSSEQTIEKMVSKRKFDRVKRKMEEKGFWALMVASMLPPPFPFTPFLIMAAVVKLPVKKMVLAVFPGRLVRYFAEGTLAILFGRHILRMLNSTGFKIALLTIFAISILGSMISIYKWVKRPRSGGSGKGRGEADMRGLESKA